MQRSSQYVQEEGFSFSEILMKVTLYKWSKNDIERGQLGKGVTSLFSMHPTHLVLK